MKRQSEYYRSEKPCAVVSPTTHATGLGAIRSLSEKGVPVVSFDWKRESLGRFSNLCLSVLKESEEAEGPIVAALLELGRKFTTKPVLFMSSDELTMFCNNSREELEKYFCFMVSGKETVEKIVKKETFYDIAGKAGIPIPRTWYIETSDDFERHKREFQYPCIVKPTTSQPFRSIFKKKAIEIANEEEFYSVQEELSRHNIRYILQEIIPGDQTKLYTFGAYSNKLGEALAIFTGRKLRQFPPDYGGCRLGEAVYDPDLIEVGKEVLKVFKFQGVSQVEFKKDDRDGRFKLIELNVRGWTWDYLATATGANLYATAYSDALGMPVEAKVSRDDGHLWHNIIEDFCNCMWLYRKAEYSEQSLSLMQWIKSIRGKKRVEAFFRWHDQMPFFYRSCKYLKQIILSA